MKNNNYGNTTRHYVLFDTENGRYDETDLGTDLATALKNADDEAFYLTDKEMKDRIEFSLEACDLPDIYDPEDIVYSDYAKGCVRDYKKRRYAETHRDDIYCKMAEACRDSYAYPQYAHSVYVDFRGSGSIYTSYSSSCGVWSGDADERLVCTFDNTRFDIMADWWLTTVSDLVATFCLTDNDLRTIDADAETWDDIGYNGIVDWLIENRADAWEKERNEAISDAVDLDSIEYSYCFSATENGSYCADGFDSVINHFIDTL